MKRYQLTFFKWLCVAYAVTFASLSQAGPFNPNNLVVERIGGDASFGGSATTPTSAATAVFVDEFTKSTGQTSPVQTIALPTSVSGSNLRLTDSGTATSNGYLTLSTDGRTLVLSGYNADVGTTGVAGSNPATITRTVGRIDQYGNVDTSTGFNNGPNGNFRSVASDGKNYWVTAEGSTSNFGVGLISSPGSVAAATNIANGNIRNIQIFNNRMFVSSGSATPGQGIHAVNQGGPPPITSSALTQIITGTAAGGSGNMSPYSFFMLSTTGATTGNYDNSGLDRLYIADDRTIANGGGLHRFDWNNTSSSWVYQYTIQSGITTGLRGLTGELVSGNVVLYATTVGVTSGSSQGNALVTVTDTGASSTFATIINSPTNTFFRGVAFTPVPEPSSILLCGFAGVSFAGVAYRRYRRNQRQTNETI